MDAQRIAVASPREEKKRLHPPVDPYVPCQFQATIAPTGIDLPSIAPVIVNSDRVQTSEVEIMPAFDQTSEPSRDHCDATSGQESTAQDRGPMSHSRSQPTHPPPQH
jgi:hypothetical protein